MTVAGLGDGEEDKLLYRDGVGTPLARLVPAHKAVSALKAPAGCERTSLSLRIDENERKTL